MARTDAQLRIRVPHDVKRWLEDQSAKNIRTVSAEVTLAVRSQMKGSEKEA